MEKIGIVGFLSKENVKMISLMGIKIFCKKIEEEEKITAQDVDKAISSIVILADLCDVELEDLMDLVKKQHREHIDKI